MTEIVTLCSKETPPIVGDPLKTPHPPLHRLIKLTTGRGRASCPSDPRGACLPPRVGSPWVLGQPRLWPCEGRATGPAHSSATASLLSPQALYVCLPALLEGPPFQMERRGSWCSAPQLPEELRRVVSVYQATLDLLRQFRVHPEIASQVLAYLFFFSGTLLFNQLLDQGEARAGCTPGGRCARSGSCHGARLLGAGTEAQGRARSTRVARWTSRAGVGSPGQDLRCRPGPRPFALEIGCHSPYPPSSPLLPLGEGPKSGLVALGTSRRSHICPLKPGVGAGDQLARARLPLGEGGQP